MQVSFGSGSVYGIPSGANPTPIQFGVLQDISMDFNFSLKELRGQFQFPVALARGAGKATWKAKAARLQAAAVNSLFFNGTAATGLELTAINELGTIAAGTFTVANSAFFQSDLGVVNSVTGVQYTRVASGPTAGQYSVTAGVYTFNVSENGTVMLASYSYTAAAGGTKIQVVNQLMGNQTTFQMIFNEKFNGQTVQFRFPSAVANKWTFGTKLEDFTIPEWDGELSADNAGNIGYFSFVE
jgi:hypothetical protein